MNYNNIFIISLLIFICYHGFSYSHEIKPGKKYTILVDSQVVGIIDVDYKLYTVKFTNENKSICNYKITFFSQNLINNNEDLPSSIDEIVRDRNQDLNLAQAYEIPNNILSNLTQKVILPLEWDFFNRIQSITDSVETFTGLSIEIQFYNSSIQKGIIFKLSGLSFNFFLSNIGVNFLIFSNLKSPNYISKNQTEFIDNENYDDRIIISKVTILNIASSNNSMNGRKSLSTTNGETSNNSNKMARSPNTPGTSDNTVGSPKKNFLQRIISNDKKCQDLGCDFRGDNHMISILNNYCSVQVTEDYFFLLSESFIKFLTNAIVDIYATNKKYKDIDIMLINPFFPIFFFNENQKLQIEMFNIYILSLVIEIIWVDNRNSFLFHFYSKGNFLNIDLVDIKDKYETDFLRIHVDEFGTITRVIIREDQHQIEYVLDE